MGTVLELTVLVSETPTGVVADLRSRRLSIIISYVIMGLGFLWSVASTNYWVILPAQALFGFGWTFSSGADVAWVTDELRGGIGNAERDHGEIDRLLLHRQRFSIFVGAGAVIAVAIVGTLTNVRVPIIVIGILYFAMAAFFALNMSEHHFRPGHEASRGFFDTLRAGLSVFVQRPRLRIVLAVVVTVNLGAEAFDRLGFDHFLETSGYDESLLVLAVLFLLLLFAGFGVNRFAIGQLTTGAGPARLTAALLVFAAFGAFIAAFGGVAVVIAFGIMLQDSIREALYPVIDGWANRDAPSELRATVHSIVGQTTSIGELGGGLLLGAIAQATSIPVSLAVAGVFFAVGAALASRGIEPRVATDSGVGG